MLQKVTLADQKSRRAVKMIKAPTKCFIRSREGLASSWDGLKISKVVVMQRLFPTFFPHTFFYVVSNFKSAPVVPGCVTAARLS